MASLQQSMMAEIRKLPQLALERLIEKKLVAAGVQPPRDLPARILAHFLSGQTEPFEWDAAGSH